ncbi:hypothetical protein [Nocardioides gilvus]|uniref:hypothetical protein n=1 Tax=Nocardioides gilvus TaxID=1735589 RepID=UPI000D7426AE|nr:hypothetical protein [Nocardioides gilvus]
MKARRTALVVCGLFLMVLGGATATYVGPDDTLIIGSHTAGQPASGQAVRTHPAITDFVNINLLVRAEAPSGVFLGYAHRVDTTSLLEGRRHWTITRMSLGNVGGDMTEGAQSSSTKALRPEGIVGWLGSTSGDSVELAVPLDGTPIDVVAVPAAGDERVRISLGATVKNLFLSQLGVIGVGLVLIAFSFVLGWWGRRTEARAGTDEPSASTPSEPTPSATPSSSQPESWEAALAAASAASAASVTPSAAAEPAPAAPPVKAPDPEVAPEPEAPRGVARESEAPRGATSERAALPVTAPLAPVAPLAPLAPTATPTAPAPAPARRRFKRRFLLLLAVFPLARIFRRRALNRRSFLTLLLIPLALFVQSCAVPGPAASNDGSLSRTGLSLAEAGQLVDDPVDVYAPEFMTYPMWAMVATGDPNRIQLRTRARFSAKWRSQGTVRLAKASEVPVSVSKAIEPGPVLQKRADAMATAVGLWWGTGQADGVGIDGLTKKARRTLLKSGVAATEINVWPASDAPLVRMVEVSGGHLLWIAHTISTPQGRYRLTTVAMMAAEPQVLGSRLAKASQD